MRTFPAIVAALIVGGIPLFAEAASPGIHCIGQDAVVPEGTPGLLKLPSTANGKFYVLSAVQDESLRNHTGVWEKNPKAPASEAKVLRIAPVRCMRTDAAGGIAESWIEVYPDQLVMGVGNLTASK